MEFKINCISVENNRGKISVHLTLENQLKEKVSCPSHLNESDMLVEIDSQRTEVSIINEEFQEECSFKLKRCSFWYNDEFITKTNIEIPEDEIAINPSFWIFEHNIKEVLNESIKTLEQLPTRDPNDKDLCSDSIQGLKILHRHFPCYLNSRYNKLIENLDKLNFPETKEILEIITDTKKKELNFIFGKAKEKKPQSVDINRYSDYDTQKPQLDQNLKTIIRLLKNRKYRPYVTQTKLIKLEKLVQRVDYVSIEERKNIFDDIKELLKGFISVISSMFGGPLVALMSITLGIIESIKKADEIGENLKNQKYEKDTLQYLGSLTEASTREQEVDICRHYRENFQITKSQQMPECADSITKLKERYNTARSKQREKYIVEIAESIIRRHGPLTAEDLRIYARRYKFKNPDNISRAIYNKNRFHVVGTVKKGKKLINTYYVNNR